MSELKKYSISSDIAAGGVNADRLKAEINSSGSVTGLSHFAIVGDMLIVFGDQISNEAVLNSVVFNHIAETLAEKKAKKVLAIDARTREIIAAGFTFDGNQFSLSTQAQTNWLGLHVLQTLFTWPMGITNNSDATYQLAQANLVPFIATGSGVIATAVGSGRALKIAVNAAATQADLDAVVDTR